MSGWIELRKIKPTEADAENGRVIVWHAFQGAMICHISKVVDNSFFSHWMRIPADGWIDFYDHQPTEADADETGCIMARRGESAVNVIGWKQMQSAYLNLWQRTPDPPEDYDILYKKY